MSTPPQGRYLDRATPPHITTLVLLSGLAAMNMTSFLPALPDMTRYFQTDYAIMQLAVSLYLACTAVLQLIVGPLADRFGRRIVTLIGLGIFLAATLGCILSTSIEIFLTFRLIQVTVASGIVLSRAVVRDLYPPDQSASMIGYVTMGMALVPMVAPTIGGALDQLFGWHAVFILLFTAGVIVTVIAFFDMGETNPGQNTSFAKQLADYPELFRSYRFWGYALCCAFASGGFFAFLGGAPYVASEVFGLSSLWAGLCFGAPAIGYATGNFISGRYAARIGINRMIVVGLNLTAVGLALSVLITAFAVDTPWVFFGFCTTVGLGNGLVIPSATAGMLSVRPHLAATASGIGGAIMIGGGAALSVLAGWAVEGRGSSLPLTVMMLLSILAGCASIQFVLRRERILARQTP